MNYFETCEQSKWIHGICMYVCMYGFFILIFLHSHPEALANTSFVNKQSTMRRYSSQDYEPIKNDFGLFAFYLNGESWQKRMTFNLKVDGDEMDSKIDKSFKFNVFEVEDASKDIAVVLIPNDFIPELLLATYAFTDATYQTVPQIVGAYQVLTLLVEIKSKVNVHNCFNKFLQCSRGERLHAGK